MKLASRVLHLAESATLGLNDRIEALRAGGKEIYNLTAGQLSDRPPGALVNLIKSECDFLKSYQYSPVPGDTVLREKLVREREKARGIDLGNSRCLITCGGKQALANALGAILNPGDEVVLLAPYWVSYPEMVKLWGGLPRIVETRALENYTPRMEDVEGAMGPRTRALIINSPNNPAGIHYDNRWMEALASLLETYPGVWIISDEIYSDLSYFDPKPRYFYQTHPHLLERTIMVDGISKALGATGLRIGYCFVPEELFKPLVRLQGQTTSGANSLIQRSLREITPPIMEEYLAPIRTQLRENVGILLKALPGQALAGCRYQTMSAFYYLLDFSSAPSFAPWSRHQNSGPDYSPAFCDDLLSKTHVALVPGQAFGVPNTARISLVSHREEFKEACGRIGDFLQKFPPEG